MTYTINKLAALAGVSVRTLHYYDQVGLLKPAEVQENGYRHYGREELLRLQRILFFRELRFPLAQIKELLDHPGTSQEQVLTEQLTMLKMERHRLDAIIETVSKTLAQEKTMDDQELYGGLSRAEMEEYEAEAKERWGNTEAYKQSKQRVAAMSKDELKAVSDRGVQIAREMAEHMEEGAESEAVQTLVDEQYRQIQRFYDCDLDMFRGLAVMTTQDARFAAYYTKFAAGLPEFRLKAVEYYCASRA